MEAVADNVEEIFEREDGSPTRFEPGELASTTADTLELFMRDVRRHPLLTGPEEIELAKRIERGDMAAKERLINSNLRLVVSQARRYHNSGLSLLDLIQEGILGLIRASEKFDWRKGFKFSTYAVLWIRQSIQRGIANSARTIRLPVSVGQLERKLAREEARLTLELGRAPTDDELAKAVDIPLDGLERVRQSARVVTSLDRPVTSEDDTPLGSVIESPRMGPFEEIALDLHEAALQRAVDTLPERERRVIELRFGLGGGEPLQLRRVADYLSLTVDQVRRLEKSALERLSMERELEALREAA